MKIIEMRPEITPWRDGQSRQVSSWSFRDDEASDDMGIPFQRRRILHYTTPMVEFHKYIDVWIARPASIGIGSATDQQGMNNLLGPRFYRDKDGHREMLQTYGYRMDRDKKGGGPRLVFTEHPSGEHIVPFSSNSLVSS